MEKWKKRNQGVKKREPSFVSLLNIGPYDRQSRQKNNKISKIFWVTIPLKILKNNHLQESFCPHVFCKNYTLYYIYVELLKFFSLKIEDLFLLMVRKVDVQCTCTLPFHLFLWDLKKEFVRYSVVKLQQYLYRKSYRHLNLETLWFSRYGFNPQRRVKYPTYSARTQVPSARPQFKPTGYSANPKG